MKRLDIWDWMNVVGACLVGGGIGANWGFAWASMFLGALLLSVAAVHEWRAGRAKGE